MDESDRITEIVGSILASYQQGGVNQVDGADVPSQQHIIEIFHTLRTLLFPGYYDKSAVDSRSLPYSTGDRVVWVYRHLSEEIRRCLCFECRQHNRCERIPDCDLRAQEIALDLLAAIPDIRSLLLLDVEATVEGDPAAYSAAEVILAYPGIAAITVHRVANFLYRRQVPLLPRIMSEYIHHRTGIDINPGATIGRSFAIDHGTGVVIGETTIIGDHVKIYQGVTLGALSVARTMQGHKRHPTIENDVIIYSGATILGGDTVIGQGSIVGGNVWLVDSIPPYSKVYNSKSAQEPIVARNHRAARVVEPEPQGSVGGRDGGTTGSASLARRRGVSAPRARHAGVSSPLAMLARQSRHRFHQGHGRDTLAQRIRVPAGVHHP